jgi:hypothetical protein
MNNVSYFLIFISSINFEKLNKKDDKLLNYFKKVDDIGTSIDGMESSVDYLDVVLSRIGI